VSSDEEIDRLVHALLTPNVGLKCVYLGNKGCVWRTKPVVCEMFLCEHARRTVFSRDPDAQQRWQRLRQREKTYTWPSRPVLFDYLETVFIKAGYDSSLMYFHNSAGLLRVKDQSVKKRTKGAPKNLEKKH
jgi:hypothetical protein